MDDALTTSQNIADALAGADLFRGAPDAALSALAEQGRRRTVRKGEAVFSVGDEGHGLFVVLSGRVLLSRVTSEGKEIALAAVEAGGIFGELSLLDGGERSADAVAVEAGELFVLDRAGFLEAIGRHPGLAMSVLAELSRRIRATNRLVESVSFLELGPRLARLLLILSARVDPDADGLLVLGARYTQGELAKRIAASRESVSKQIAQWQREGVLELVGGRIAIRDIETINFLADDIDLER